MFKVHSHTFFNFSYLSFLEFLKYQIKNKYEELLNIDLNENRFFFIVDLKGTLMKSKHTSLFLISYDLCYCSDILWPLAKKLIFFKLDHREYEPL